MHSRSSPEPLPVASPAPPALGRRPVLLRAALAQLAAGLILAALAPPTPQILTGPLAHGLLAALCSALLRLPWWWLPIQFAFVPAVVAALSLAIAPGWFLAGFLGLAAVYWSAWRNRVPLYLSGPPVWRALESLLPARGRVRDLGSGLGGPLLFLARRHSSLHFEGIEAAPLPWLVSRLRALGVHNLSFRLASFWRHDLGSDQLVFAYLSPAAMPALWEKVRHEMRPGSVFVSVEFPVPGVEPDEIIETGGRQRLYVWRF